MRSGSNESQYMRLALQLAHRAYGQTSPNPMVGAVLVNKGMIIGHGWHQRAGMPHAEIEAIQNARKFEHSTRDATLYVTLEPCCTHGRTPPCTDAIINAGIKRVVVAATDPNPAHAGKGFGILKKSGIEVAHGLLADEATRLNEAFNHWIVCGVPLVTVKSAMTLDGKIATASGESKWITSAQARAYAMKLRLGADAILVGVNTILADDPSLTVRLDSRSRLKPGTKTLRRIVLDSKGRTPLTARVIADDAARSTTIVVTKSAPKRRVAALSKKVNVLVAPEKKGRIDLRWLLKKLGAERVASLLVEGGGEVNASFFESKSAQRVAFFYAPKIMGGRDARKAVAGEGVKRLEDMVHLREIEWKRLGPDLLLTARVEP